MARRRADRMSLERARWRLGTIWFSGSAIIFLLLVMQSLLGGYEDRVQAVWGWALPNFLPSLMLMMGVFAGSALVEESDGDRMSVRRSFVTLASALSVFHLACVLLTLLVQPFLPALSGGPVSEPMKSFETSNLWLGPLQGLVGAAMGALFFTKSKEEAAAGTDDDADDQRKRTPAAKG